MHRVRAANATYALHERSGRSYTGFQAVRDILPTLELESLGRLADQLGGLIRGRLWAQVLAAMALGIGTGLLLGPDLGLLPKGVSRGIVAWLAFPGNLFLALIQMIVVPLVFASVIRGLTAGESLDRLKTLGGWALGFFGVTTAAATVLGIGVGQLIRPGDYVDVEAVRGELGGAALPDSPPPASASLPSFTELPDTLTGLLPTNPLEALVGGEMLQIILFAILMGVALLALPSEKSGPLYDLLGSLQDVSMKVVQWAMRLAPLAVFGLMARLTSTVGLDTLAGMGVYVGTVLLGLVLLFLVYVVLIAGMGRRSPWTVLRGSRELLLLAFSTSSSAAVMPLSIKTAEALEVRSSTARFLIPLGATINMTGTALYQGVATVFLAQVFGVELGPVALTLVVVTAVAASVGSPATPGVGMVILATVLRTVGIPPSGVVLLIGVDRVLDMSRTAVNVFGDLVACIVVDRLTARASSATRAEAQT